MNAEAGRLQRPCEDFASALTDVVGEYGSGVRHRVSADPVADPQVFTGARNVGRHGTVRTYSARSKQAKADHLEPV